MDNILLLTTGSANSTITTKMLGELGWHLNDADDEFAESVEARRINMATIKSGMFDRQSAMALLNSLRSPWVLKDPRFSQTLRQWMPLFGPYRPLLLYITKDIGYVKNSIKRRFGMNGTIAEQRLKWCREYYRTWPYSKLQFDVAQISAAVALFDPGRSFKYNVDCQAENG